MSKKRRIFARFVVDARDDADICHLSHEAFRLWWSSILWCRDKGNDGFVPEHMLVGIAPPVRVPSKAKDELVRTGFFVRDLVDGKDGWTIKAYAEYQDTAATIDARKAAAGKANGVRWGSESDTESDEL